MKAHRPFWVLRHRVSGAIKTTAHFDLEDGMWEVLLTDGSAASEGDRLVGELSKKPASSGGRRGAGQGGPKK